MIQTNYCPDKFRTYLSHPERNDHILRRVVQLEKEFSCTLMPSQITDVFYANFIQWAHERGNCYSTIKLYCNQLKSALNWASRHGCKLSQTYNVYEVPRYFKSRVALSLDEISHIAHFDVSKVARRPQYRRTLERVRDMFVLLCNLGQRFSDIRRISRRTSSVTFSASSSKKPGTGPSLISTGTQSSRSSHTRYSRNTVITVLTPQGSTSNGSPT